MLRIDHYKPDGTLETLDKDWQTVGKWIRDNQVVSEQELREARKALKRLENNHAV